MILRSLLSAGLLVLVPAGPGAAQNVNGDCNVVFGDNARSNSVVVFCPPDFGPLARLFGGGGGAALEMEAATEGLRAGADRFVLILQNRSETRPFYVVPDALSLSDEAGHVYGLDCFRMTCVRQIAVQPGRVLRLDYALTRAIRAGAAEIVFTLDNLWSGRPDGFRDSHGALTWNVALTD